MSNDSTPSDPAPELLAAFLDGELDPAARARVEAWLAGNQLAAAEVEGQRRALRLWQANPPPEPGPAAWDATRARIAARLPAPRRRPLPWPRTLWLGAGAAAAVLAVVLLTRLFQPVRGPDAANDPLPVIAPGDVVVISMDARDASGLVVAAPPVPEPILLASQDDVSVMNLASYGGDDGPVPHIGEGDVPMIVAPADRPRGQP